MAPTLLWIGLGNMGRGMSKNIVEKGNMDGPLLLYNRSTKRTTDFSATLPAGKTEVIESLADGVARADIIFSCIANDEAVQETYKTMLESDVKGKLFIESSTIHPETTEAIAKIVTDKGAEFVAAPVFGAPQMADAGQLVGVLAGPAASVTKAKAWFKGVTSKADIDLSDQPYSKALTLKVLGNTFILNMAEQLAEAHVAAEKTGLGTEAIHQFVQSVFGGPYAAYSERMLTGDYYKREEPLFAVELARKDARHAMNLAKSAGVQLRNVEAADAHLAMAYDHIGSSADMAGIYGAVRKESGLKMPIIDNFHFTGLGYAVFIGLAVVGALCVASWFLAPKGENQVSVNPSPPMRFLPGRSRCSIADMYPHRLWRSSTILAIVCCYLMWAITFLAQLHPLIAPRKSGIREEYLD
ncbi:uncharacterized protein FIESC28_04342 [Fusarium coffeatum]|uniref:6-phosphogluconate dehydrogenase NADP-binding domain-containing protein n=1 Tax=Fusarium coffeatum TaxID=231269 RepID=A0A366S0D0_9HYPO|nr:uncharacterized protein FIESC28_04342 [Fusarium coffeatum]RBR22779.1 hypothetical protein FIESC28_04342 [Fusarium coffeatum]